MRPNAVTSRAEAIFPLCILLFAITYTSAASLRLPIGSASRVGRSGMQANSFTVFDGPRHGGWLRALRGGADAVSAEQAKVRMGVYRPHLYLCF